MSTERFTGLIAAVHTPMTSTGELDLDAVAGQARLLTAGELDAVFVAGTTGEGLSLSVAERKALVERWRSEAPDMPLIVHVGALSIADSRELADHAARSGANAIAAVGPCYHKPATVADLVAFCAEVAGTAPDLPFYYYHIPSLSGVKLSVRDFLSAGVERIASLAGAKFSDPDLMDFARCVRLEGGRFNMLFGLDEMLLSALVLGADGAVGAGYNFAAPLYLRIIRAVESGDLPAAREAQAMSAELMTLFSAGGGVPAGKAIMKMIGLDLGPVRPQLRTLSDEEFAALRDELQAIGFFEYCMKAC